jgi:ubiquinone/menaquinone biosynthesis C-methylase UbiE
MEMKVMMTPPNTPSTYFMESQDEGLRLEAKTDAGLAERQLSLSGLRPKMRALDLGCGTGAVTRVMVKMGAERAVGVDASGERLATARELALKQGCAADFVEGKAGEVPFATGTFDYTWARFLFEYLPDKSGALAEMVRVTKPGGRVAVADLDGQLQTFFPMEPDLESEWAEAIRLLHVTGFDPNVGRKLYHLFNAAGFENINVRVEPYQVYAGRIPDKDLANWTQKLSTGLDFLCRTTGEVTRWRTLSERMNARLREQGVFYHSTMIMVWGDVPNR